MSKASLLIIFKSFDEFVLNQFDKFQIYIPKVLIAYQMIKLQSRYVSAGLLSITLRPCCVNFDLTACDVFMTN